MKRFAIAVMFASTFASADTIPADAQALFDQGITDMQAGKLDVACKELAASLAKYSDSGTKGALASCYTKAGKIASAWVLWKELADTESDATRRANAAQHATDLGPKLPRYKVALTGTPPAGFTVTINAIPVADPTLPTALPIDPGPLAIVAKAPGFDDFTATLQATDGHTTDIEIPALHAKGAAGPVDGPRPVIPDDPVAGKRHARHLYGAILVGVGAAGLAVGIVEGLGASSTFDEAKTICGGDINACPQPMVMASQLKVNDARNTATISTIAFGVGGAALVTGAILWFTAPAAESSRIAVVPAIAPGSAGVVLSGRW